ncbi:MAG TPA: AraC family transcriptional regulator ligand-binding domain-containing protein [Kofleriaceae bacterium]|nr:AraC family transcriptional regulator ligand-binding domain-containing protein [Kofleriaceae bacterium]
MSRTSSSTSNAAPHAFTRAQLVGPALEAARRAGVDIGEVIARHGLPATAATDPEASLTLTALRRLLEELEKQMPAGRLLSVDMVGRVPASRYGVAGYVARYAPTLRHALWGIARFYPLNNEVASQTFEEGEAVATVRHTVDGEPLAMGAAANEYYLAFFTTWLRARTEGRAVARRAWLAHPRRKNAAALAEALALPSIEYGAGSNGVELDRAALDLELRGDAALFAILCDHGELLLAARAGRSSRFLGLVVQQLRDELRRGPPTLEGVATRMRVSARTLQRKLAAESTSFQALADDVRVEAARELLSAGRLAVGQIALELHYADVSTFVRAFKRLVGLTPGEYAATRR